MEQFQLVVQLAVSPLAMQALLCPHPRRYRRRYSTGHGFGNLFRLRPCPACWIRWVELFPQVRRWVLQHHRRTATPWVDLHARAA